jgi:phage terminase large subunit-like protein
MSAPAAAQRTAPLPSPEWRKKYAQSARAELYRRSLYEFVKASWHVLEPGTEYEDNWHIWALCFHIQMMLEGWMVANGHAPANGNERQKAIRRRAMLSWEMHGLKFREKQLLVQNAILNLGPGTMKSRIVMVCAAAWMWLHVPSFSVCAISNLDDNVRRDSNHHRELVGSAWYRQTFGIEWTFDKRQNSVKDWATTAGGIRKSRTMMGNFTGMRVDCILLDDPEDAFGVHSESKRRQTKLKWRNAIKNRVNHLARSLRICLQQRLHIDDWTSAQVATAVWAATDRKGWMWIAWPLRYGRGPRDCPAVSPYGFRDPRGNPLWNSKLQAANDNLQPSRFPDDVIADELRDKGSAGFAAQYDQNPENYDDGWVKRAWVRFFRLAGTPKTTRERPHGCGVRMDAEGNLVREEAYVLEVNERTGRPDLDFLALTVDATNGSESDTASAVGLLVVGGKGLARFIFDDMTRVMGPEEQYAAIVAAIIKWPVESVVIETAALGRSSIDRLRTDIQGGRIKGADGRPISVNIIEIKVGTDSKESRFSTMVPDWEQGLVYVLDGADWLYAQVDRLTNRVIDEGLVAEITKFPRVKRKDRADALSQVLTHYRDQMSMEARWKAHVR